MSALAEKGTPADVMTEPLAKILMIFDQVHDVHKAKDVIEIDISIEAQFKSSLDNLFILNDVRDDALKI